jgi:uncharacterized protein (TIGR00297 family)
LTNQLFLGFLLAVLVAAAAWWFKSLSISGALGAALIGTIIFGLGGWKWAIILLTFFISSSILSRMFLDRKSGLSEKFEKGSQRDASQVLANGGIAAVLTLFHYFFPSETWPWIGFAASMAAVNADTWATELGVLNPGLPRLMTNFKRVEKGTSGAISLTGTLASFLGAGLVAFIAILLMPMGNNLFIFGIISAAGLFGSGFDSYLGATAQAIYRCPSCNKETEKHPIHNCGTETTLIRGMKWLNNDVVNTGCALAGLIFALFFLWILN